MIVSALIGLASIIIVGIAAEWLSWRIRLPSILLLLLFGFILGPLTGFLDPDALFGDILIPVVSLAVAIILFEGGLNLRISELRTVESVIIRLISLGTLVSWAVGAAAAYFFLGLDLALATLLGAILVVTGPTVIIPLLRHLRLGGRVGSLLKWEGIVIDPIGAILAIIIFQVIAASGMQEAGSVIVLSLLTSVLANAAIGAIAALIVIVLLRSYLVPDYLHSAVTLVMVILAFTLANIIQEDSGLLAATIMGIVLANQKIVSVRHIAEFKENLRILLISGLFILLAARLSMSDLSGIGLGSIIFLAVLIFIARPLSVMLSTFKSKLNWKERLFLGSVAPRGIVAAAVASIFALRLVERGFEQAELLVPFTFFVIAGTVLIYGFSATPVGRALRLASPNPQGFLIIGANQFARTLGLVLIAEGYKVFMVDDNWLNISRARMSGISSLYANVLSQYALDEVDLGGIGYMLAITPDNEYNSLAIVQFANIFDRAHIFQLCTEQGIKYSKDSYSRHLRGRLLFGQGITYEHLASRLLSGAIIKTTTLTSKFDYSAFKEYYADSAVPMFTIEESGKITPFTIDNRPKPRAGQKLISIVDEEE